MYRGDVMFERTSQKIMICAYIFFFGNTLRQAYREIWQFIQLGNPTDLLINTICNILTTSLTFLIISLVIYGFGKIVEYYEKKSMNLK